MIRLKTSRCRLGARWGHSALLQANVSRMWSRLPRIGNLPSPRSSHGLAVVGKKVFVFSGEKEPRVSVGNDLYYYDLNSQHWSKSDAKGELPKPRVGHACTSAGSKIYLFGGRTGINMGEGLLDDLHCFDTETSTWSLLETHGQKPCGRSYLSMISNLNKLYLFGGCSDGRHNDLYSFDIETSKWIQLPTHDAIKPRGGPGLVAIGSDIYVIAGFTGEEVNDMHRFNTLTETWETLSPTPNIPPISVFGMTNIGSKILVMCGEVSPSSEGHAGAGGFSKDVYVYDTEKAALGWSKLDAVGDIPSPRGWLPAVSMEGDKAVIFGGNSASNDRLDDLYILSLKY